MIFWVTLALAAAPALQDIKKTDFSILLQVPSSPQQERGARCFVLAEVAEALSRVQQRMRLHQNGLRLTRCYQPADALFGRGAAVVAEAAQKEMPGSGRALRDALAAEGFASRGKGTYVFKAREGAPLVRTAIADLP